MESILSNNNVWLTALATVNLVSLIVHHFQCISAIKAVDAHVEAVSPH